MENTITALAATAVIFLLLSSVGLAARLIRTKLETAFAARWEDAGAQERERLARGYVGPVPSSLEEDFRRARARMLLQESGVDVRFAGA